MCDPMICWANPDVCDPMPGWEVTWNPPACTADSSDAAAQLAPLCGPEVMSRSPRRPANAPTEPGTDALACLQQPPQGPHKPVSALLITATLSIVSSGAKFGRRECHHHQRHSRGFCEKNIGPSRRGRHDVATLRPRTSRPEQGKSKHAGERSVQRTALSVCTRSKVQKAGLFLPHALCARRLFHVRGATVHLLCYAREHLSVRMRVRLQCMRSVA